MRDRREQRFRIRRRRHVEVVLARAAERLDEHRNAGVGLIEEYQDRLIEICDGGVVFALRETVRRDLLEGMLDDDPLWKPQLE